MGEPPGGVAMSADRETLECDACHGYGTLGTDVDCECCGARGEVCACCGKMGRKGDCDCERCERCGVYEYVDGADLGMVDGSLLCDACWHSGAIRVVPSRRVA